MVNEVRPVDANELLKQSVYCKGEDGTMFYAVPASSIIKASTLTPKYIWNTPYRKPTKADADRSGYVLAIHKNDTHIERWLAYIVAEHPEKFYCWYPLPEPKLEVFDHEQNEKADFCR